VDANNKQTGGGGKILSGKKKGKGTEKLPGPGGGGRHHPEKGEGTNGLFMTRGGEKIQNKKLQQVKGGEENVRSDAL